MLTIRHARAREDWNDKNLAEKGFTLVELLVVIIILGVLAAVVVIAVNGFQEDGKLKACQTEKRSVESAAAAYYARQDPNAYPTWAQLTGVTPPLLKNPEYSWTISSTNGDASNPTPNAPTGC